MKKLFYIGALLLWLPTCAQYHSLLWKISGNGLHRPAYLFGTMHSADPRVKEKCTRALTYFDSCGSYAMELDPEKALNPFLVTKLMMGKNFSLKEMIPQAEYLLLDSVIRNQTGFSAALFDHIAPVFVMTIFEMASMNLSDSLQSDDDILDMYLYHRAKEQRKKIIGIETAEEQLDALNALSYPDQAEMLLREIHEYQKNKNSAADMVRYYLQENLDSLNAGNTDDSMPEKFYKALVTDRNKRMAKRIGEFIQQQATFVAIGALHLPGDKGVIALLRHQGYLVEPISIGAKD